MGAMQQSLLATAAAVANTLDTVIYVGRTGLSAGTAGITVPAPGSYINGDLLVLVITSTNQTITTPTAGGTWTQVLSSPQGTGTAGASQSIQVAVFTKIASGDQADVTIADTGVLTTGAMFVFRKVNQTTPVEVTAGSVLATAGTTHTLPAVTTSTNNAMIAHVAGIGRDAVSTINYSSPTNANLTGLTVRMSQTTSTANGGGIGLVTGTKTVAGATGTTSVTVAGAAKGAFVTLGVKPSVNFDASARVVGIASDDAPNGIAYCDDTQYYASPAYADVSLYSNTAIGATGSPGFFRSNWLNNASSGSGYYVRAVARSGSGNGTINAWLPLASSGYTWSVEAVSDGINPASAGWDLEFQFATDSGGTNIVATSSVTLTASSDPGPIP